ncbi:hypothetical protein V6N13_090077 [Hibiscus sabdariffa]
MVEQRVHPDCINASNPFHECVAYCFRKIAEAKARKDKSETDKPREIKMEEQRVHPDCINAWNPFHECVAYCFRKIAEAKAGKDKLKTETPQPEGGQPVSFLAYQEQDVQHCVPEESSDKPREIKMEEQRVHPDCINASNPFHECVAYCFRKIAEAKARKDKLKTETPQPEDGQPVSFLAYQEQDVQHTFPERALMNF